MKHNYTLLRCFCYSAFFFFISLRSSSQPLLTYTSKLGGLNFPVDLVHDGTNRMFIVQQDGIVRRWMPPATTFTTFMDISSSITFSDERGLLSMAFHPNYNGVTNRYFFVYHTRTAGSITTIRVVRYETVLGDPDAVDLLSASEVIAIDKPPGFTNHNGGKLNFGTDGMLYFGTGDGGSGNDPFNNAQNGQSLLGKMLRIDINGSTPSTPMYSIPPDNPFLVATDPTDLIRDEVWALGLRNPFRWSFDPLTQAMWIGDVGQGQQEEVDIKPASPTTGGVNYGWRCYEGTLQPPPGITACSPLPTNYIPPTFTYGHNSTNGGFSITGGVVYRGTGSPLLYSYYVFSDYVSNNVWVMDQSGVARQQPFDLNGVAGFGADITGEIYAVARGGSANTGQIVSITSSVLLPVSFMTFTGKHIAGYNELKWTTASEQDADRFIVEVSFDGINFSSAGEVAANNQPRSQSYQFLHVSSGLEKTYYRLLLRNLDGGIQYSSVIVLGGKENGVKVYPTIVQNSQVTVTSSAPVEVIKVFDMDGRELYRNNISGSQGYFTIQLPSLTKGMYLVTVQSRESSYTQKIIIQ